MGDDKDWGRRFRSLLEVNIILAFAWNGWRIPWRCEVCR